MRPQQFNWLVHDKARDGLRRQPKSGCRFLVAEPISADLLDCAKDLFLEAIWRRMARGSMVTVVSAHTDERRHRPRQ
jgi:hypothetical protein